jgi:deoxyribodipyrimidine photo-lyase
MPKPIISICWFRRDLRLNDQHALHEALKSEHPVLPLFIFDKSILDKLDNKADKRVHFIHQAITEMDGVMQKNGSGFYVHYGFPMDAFEKLTNEFDVAAVYTNHDYEPYATQRDAAIEKYLNSKGITFYHFKDQVVFEKKEVVKDDGNPYTVFTPYSRKWKSLLTEKTITSFPSEKYLKNFCQYKSPVIPSLESMGFQQTDAVFPPKEVRDDIVKKYSDQRDIPSIAGTSRLSVHLRFGTVSVRDLVRKTKNLSETFLNELIWRDFYHMILWNFPQVGAGKAFKKEYDEIQWRHNESDFEKWCKGETGYPIVDAGMRELNTTGFMHNRVRMIVASFLTKHLLIDWRWGEAYFAEKLLDFDLAANNGGWQWAAGSGCDAAPYFRIFNPYLQTKKFDPELKYIRKWVPEFEDFGYAKPVVNHEFARKRCLEVYAKGLKKDI